MFIYHHLFYSYSLSAIHFPASRGLLPQHWKMRRLFNSFPSVVFFAVYLPSWVVLTYRPTHFPAPRGLLPQQWETRRRSYYPLKCFLRCLSAVINYTHIDNPWPATPGRFFSDISCIPLWLRRLKGGNVSLVPSEDAWAKSEAPLSLYILHHGNVSSIEGVTTTIDSDIFSMLYKSF